MTASSERSAVSSKKTGENSIFKRIVFCLPLTLLLLTVAEAQQPKKALIGYLSSGDAATESARSEAIRLALRERGHIEGQNVAIEYRYAEGKPNRASELVAELV